MTNDITELAQREKFEAWAELVCALPWAYLKKRRTSDDTYSESGYTDMWAAWKAAGTELVDALEKAQGRDVIQSAKDYHFDQQADRIAELDAELEREREKSRRVMSRIAELESRTVKLPDFRHERFNSDWGEHDAEAYQVVLREALTAAGIKWEAE